MNKVFFKKCRCLNLHYNISGIYFRWLAHLTLSTKDKPTHLPGPSRRDCDLWLSASAGFILFSQSPYSGFCERHSRGLGYWKWSCWHIIYYTSQGSQVNAQMCVPCALTTKAERNWNVRLEGPMGPTKDWSASFCFCFSSSYFYSPDFLFPTDRNGSSVWTIRPTLFCLKTGQRLPYGTVFFSTDWQDYDTDSHFSQISRGTGT